MRQRGQFSEVYVYWRLVDVGTNNVLRAGDEFDIVEGNVTFGDLQSVAEVIITPSADGRPEYSDRFAVQLYDVGGETCTLNLY